MRCREEFRSEVAGERHAIDAAVSAASEVVADHPSFRPTKVRDRADVMAGLLELGVEDGIDIRDAMAMVDAHAQQHLERTLTAHPPPGWVPFGSEFNVTSDPNNFYGASFSSDSLPILQREASESRGAVVAVEAETGRS